MMVPGFPVETVPFDLAMKAGCVDLLTRAFLDDELYEHVQPDKGLRHKALMWMHDRVLRYCLKYGIVHTTSRREGVACWLKPGGTDITLPRILRSGLVAMPAVFGPSAYRRFDVYLEISGRLRKRHTPPEYYYLWVLGVDPGLQGMGIGAGIMRTILERADNGKMGCFTETESERNVEFYEKLGFRVVAEETIPGANLMTWSMLRAPAGK